MAEFTTHATARPRLAAQDRHPLKEPVALPLFPFNVHRPASTIRDQAAARAASSTI